MECSIFKTTIKKNEFYFCFVLQVNRKLYIFAGQRNKEYINDFFTYDVDTHTLGQIYKLSENDIGICPTPGFTQRATIDPDMDEIFVLSVRLIFLLKISISSFIVVLQLYFLNYNIPESGKWKYSSKFYIFWQL